MRLKRDYNRAIHIVQQSNLRRRCNMWHHPVSMQFSTPFDFFSDLYKTSDEPTRNIICNETYPCVLKPPDLVSFPEPSFVWEFRRNSNETFSKIEKSHEGSARFVKSLEGHLCVFGVSQRDQGQYRCRISNIARNVYEVYDVTLGT